MDKVFPPDGLRSFAQRCLMACSVSEADAHLVADSLVKANLRGVDSHGITRLEIYTKRLRAGLVNPTPNVRLVRESAGTLLIDGDNGLGQVVGMRGLELGLSKLEQSGNVAVGIRRSNHYGAAAYYVQRAVEEDVITFAYSNAPPTMAPWGGVEPYVGTNPYAFGVPAGEHEPIVVDMATSTVARGKIILAAKKGEQIPEGWAIDNEGLPTTDARAALEGSVLPFGGPKGYAISLMVDIMSGALTGAGFGPRIRNLYEDFDNSQNVGAFFQLTAVRSFMPVHQFKNRVDQMISEIKAVRHGVGIDEIFIPGEMEQRMELERRISGIPLGAETVSELQEVGKICGVELDDFAHEK